MRFFASLILCAAIAATVAGCETVRTPVNQGPVVSPGISHAPVRIRSTFVADDAGEALTKYVYPNGVLAARDAAHAKDVSNFIAQKNIHASMTLFLRSAMFAADRTALARQLRLIP